MRPALEAAIAVARAGELEHPPIPAPTKLLPYLEFSKYPQAALDVARRVLDEDEQFRARVVEHVDLDQLGEAAQLFLCRPAGWGASLAKLEESATSQAQSQAAERQERRATKQLQITKEALEQARSHAYEEAAQAGKLRDELAVARAERTDLEVRVAELEHANAQARDERANAIRDLKAMESRLADRTSEWREALDRASVLETQLEAARAQPASAEAAPLAPVDAPTEPEPAAATAEVPFDQTELANTIAAASRAATELAAALHQAARTLQPPVEPAHATLVDGAASHPPVERRRRRRPVRLPVGVFDDSVEAAAALVSVPEMLLMVDGYNVTLSGWPDLPLVFQRERLIDALAALQAKTGVGVLVVFDGADAGRNLPPESRLRGVQVRFTDPGIEADDVLIDAVSLVPADRPVTVVSSDHRVRDGAGGRGANLLSSQQLLELLRR